MEERKKKNIRRKSPTTGKVDAEAMVNIVAQLQRTAGMKPDITIIRKIFCLLADPVKTTAYRQQMMTLRDQFKGLAKDEQKQNQFRQAVQAGALRVTTVSTAVKLGIPKIVRSETPLD